MKSKTLAFATLMLVTAFLLMQAIAPLAALAGTSWTDTGGGLSGYTIYSLAYDSVHNVLYAGTGSIGVWKYDGTIWTNTGGGVSGYSIPSLAYDSTHDVLYAGTSNGVWKYDGTIWTDTGGGVLSCIFSLAYDSSHNLLYAVASNVETNSYGVWKYDGMIWTDIGGGLSGYSISSLAYDSSHNLLYANASNVETNSYGVWKYDGMSWTDTGGGVSGCTLAYDSTHNLLYAGTEKGVWKYDGTSWTDTGGGLSGYYIPSLAYDSSHNLLYAGCYDPSGGPLDPKSGWRTGIAKGVWKYDGTSWTDTGGGVSSYYISSLAYDSTYDVLYAGTDGGYGVWRYATPAPTSRTWGHDSIGVTTPAQDWYLAEGCTAGGFETWVLVQNPNDSPAEVSLTYMTPAGPVSGPTANLPPNTRKTFNVADTVPGNWEVSTKVSANKPLIAERAMYGPGRAWGTDSIGASQTSKTWYLAEGCTNGGFETWALVQNPNDKPADVSLTYMTPEGQKPGPSVTLLPNTRKTFNVADTVPGNWEVSTLVSSKEPVIAERAVYWNNRKGGHESIGVTNPEETWYLAEGSTGGTFETWILVQNPGDSIASVDLTYMTEAGEKPGPHLDLAPHSRKTVNVAELVPDTWSVSTKVTSKQPVIAERAVYWNGRIEGHDSIGTTTPAKTWYLAEGCTGAGFETWVLVQNPNPSPAGVQLTYMTPSGPVVGPSETIGSNSRKTFNVAETVPGVYEVSTKVTSNLPVIAEKAMYGDGK
ncbi:MAG: hypothetical protein KJ686_03025 [Actinobacteria bacterium]|nr:hypothetical protein [Actinomycetota bacterium]